MREEQQPVLEKLLAHVHGVLCGTTVFGKTVVAIELIAERRVNTLILVDKISLVSQWKKRLQEFLIINECLPDTNDSDKRGRKKAKTVIGQWEQGEIICMVL